MRRYKAAPLTCEEQDTLAIRAKAGDLEARNMLVASIVCLIAKQAWAISKPDEDVEDYVQEAVVKILENVHRYDPKRGHFTTFMLPWAAGGRHIWKHKQGWQRAYRNGRTAFYSMDKKIDLGGRKALTIGDTIAAEVDDSFERQATDKAVKDAIREASLNDRERRLLEMALALDLECGFQSKCADALGISRERVGQIWTGRNGCGIGVLGKLKAALGHLVVELA